MRELRLYLHYLAKLKAFKKKSVSIKRRAKANGSYIISVIKKT